MLRAYINEIEYKLQRDFRLSDKIGNVSGSDIAVLVEAQPIPRAGDIIEIKDDATGEPLFWGTCGIPRSPEFSTGLEPRVYSITCGNGNAILGRRIVNVAYQDYTVTQIVTRLFEMYISMEGITLGAISDIPVTIEIYTAANFNLQKTLTELAELVGATWQITPDRKFYFVASEDFPNFPRVIDPDFLIGRSLQHTTTDQKLRTVQYIAGATDITSPQTETFVFDGEQKNFLLAFPVIREPAIFINDVQIAASRVGINGISDSDDEVWFTFSYASPIIPYKKDDVLEPGDVVKIVYVGQFPIRIAVFNDSKIAEIAEHTGTSGYIEDVRLATTIKTSADAQQLGESLVLQYDDVTEEVKMQLRSKQLYDFAAAFGLALNLESTAVLTQLSFNLPALGIVGDYVIIERTLSPLDAVLDKFDEQLIISLRLVNRDYLKSYAQTLAVIRRDITNLTIRGDDIIVQTNYVPERVNLSEIVSLGAGISLFPAPVVADGSLFSGQALDCVWYPAPEYRPITGAFDVGLSYCPTTAVDGAVFSPVNIESEVFPV